MVSAEDLLIEYVIGPVGAADIIRGLQIYGEPTTLFLDGEVPDME
ncbi:hypothetical protein [Mesorhizobium sp. DCY119]|nr:hypothetical protein [Mesorhizobium sp. DCY119]